MTRGRTAASVAIAAWLVAQMAVPAWLFLHDRADRSTDFSWDMFSHRINCSRLSFAARTGGEWRTLEPGMFFGAPYQLRRVLYRDRLSRFGAHACARLGADELRGVARCRNARAGPEFELVDPARDLCR